MTLGMDDEFDPPGEPRTRTTLRRLAVAGLLPQVWRHSNGTRYVDINPRDRAITDTSEMRKISEDTYKELIKLGVPEGAGPRKRV